MANTFKNYTGASNGTGATTTYTVPSSTTSVMIGCNFANRTASSMKVEVHAAGIYIIKDAPIPSGAGSLSLGWQDHLGDYRYSDRNI